MKNSTVRILLALLVLGFLASGSVLADDEVAADTASDVASDVAAGQTDDLFIESYDVNLINVEVYVTDKQGNRIDGLTKDDFVLSVNKRPMAISNFYVVQDGKALNETVPVIDRPVSEQPELVREDAEPLPPDDQRLHLIVYIDNFNLRPFSRNRVIRSTRAFLRKHLRPGDEVMLASYDRSLKIRHPFTSDPSLIASALYELEDISAHGVHFDSERRDILDLIYNEAEEFYDVRGRAVQYAESIFNDMAFTLDALRDQIETLAGLPGRKAVLYVSDGLSIRPGEDIFYALNDKFNETSILLESHRFDLSRRFQSVIQQANANRVTFYTVDAAGLRTYSYMDASNHTAGGGARIDQVHFSNIQSPLHLMAEETGGFVMINTNNFDPMFDRMASDFGNYYSLGFTPGGEVVTGRYHQIKVELKKKQKGVRLRYREGYRDKPLSTRMADSARAALHFGYQKNNLGVELEAGRGDRQDDGNFLVPFTVKIPLGKLSFLPQKETHRGRIRLYIAAKDSEGGLAEVQEVPVPIDIPSQEYDRAKGQFYHYQITLLMRKGRQMLAVGVRDEIGAATGFVTKGVLVGS